MRRGGAPAAMVAVALLAAAAAPPALADSYTWGYGYGRTRTAEAPVAADGPAPASAGPSASAPFVVPLPGQSQSTPVVVGGTWYEWTYWDGGLQGALWTGQLDAATGGSTPGAAVTLPGRSGPVVALSAASPERLDEPSDAAVSPDGRWVAFGAGDRLYWWPSGDPAAGGSAEIAGPSYVEANSTSPTFVPDTASASGWDVCDGNWDGGFACFAAGGPDPLQVPTAGVYQVDWTAAGDAGGYAAITSSAAYGGPLGDLYFGVASAADPRLMALDPHSGAFLAMDGGGRVQAPVWSAVALDGGDVYATDAGGTPYRFDAASGRLEADLPLAPSGVDIAAPAVSGPYLYLLVLGTHEILRLDRESLAVDNQAPVDEPGLTQASALTVVDDPAAAPEVFYASEDGGVDLDVPGGAGPGGAPGGLSRLASWPGPAAGGGYNFTAAVVDGDFILLWSDGAAAAWSGAAAGEAAAPSGFGAAPGGIQLYRLRPRLSALVAPGTAAAGQGSAVLTVLAPVGASVSASAAGAALDLQPAPGSAPACPAPLPDGAGPGFGRFPASGPDSPGPAQGCGPLSGDLAGLSAAAAAAGTEDPDFAGLAPQQWQAAGAGYDALQASIPVPAAAGPVPIAVTATMPDGNRSAAAVWLTVDCPAGWAPDPGGSCTVGLAAGPDPWAGGGGTGPPPQDGCSPDLVPGRDGWTQQEFALLCQPLGSLLVDPGVLDCYGTWWNLISHQYLQKGCVTAGDGSYAGP